MDQVKVFLKAMVTYRFWISAGISALLPLIAYFVGSGPIKAETEKVAKDIKGASEKVTKYKNPGVTNAQWKPIVVEKKDILSKDVDATWKKLYDRQAPLLRWPAVVESQFQEWGKKWPQNVDKGVVQKAISDYVIAYPEFVTRTYKIVNAWDPIEGTGVVVAPPEPALLSPAGFTIENPPTLGKVWAAQERLWIQGTLLDVVAKVNGKAKDWDGAVVKQINFMNVGVPQAQDQKSLVKGDTLEQAPELNPDGTVSVPEAAGGGAAAGDPMGMASQMMSMKGAGGEGMGGMSGGPSKTEEVYYIKPASETAQFKIMPIQMSVLVDQNRLQDFLIGLENSPMTIQVMDFEFSKPMTPVQKPEVGMQMNFGGMMGGRGMMGGMMGRGDDMMPGMMGGGAGMQGMMGPRGGGMGMMGAMGGDDGMMPGMMGGMGGGGAPTKTGKSIRDVNKAKERQEKKKKKATASTKVDIYYNVVEVVVYGQARFYNAPPPPEAAPGSENPTPAADPAAPAAETPKAADPADTPKAADAPKAEAPKAEAPKAEAPKAEAPKAEAPKAEAPKAEAPKAEAPKAEAPKADAPKAEAPKAEAPKADAPKGDAPKS